MQSTKLFLTGLTLAGLAGLSACSSIPRPHIPGVYKIDIQQGNIITQDMVDQLRPGMTESQVKFIMGTPLIMDTFHANRWDYLYSIQPGGGKRYQERLTLLFDNNMLVSLSGDFLPGRTREEEILNEGSGAQISTEEPKQQQPETDVPIPPGDLLKEIQGEVDSIMKAPVPEIETIEPQEYIEPPKLPH